MSPTQTFAFPKRTTLPNGTTDAVMRAAFPPAAIPYDPVQWVMDNTSEFLWSKQKEILNSLRDNRYTAVMSCHDSGKSFTGSRACVSWIGGHPLGRAFVATTAPTWPQVKTILWREISRGKSAANAPGRILQDASWKVQLPSGDEVVVGYGRKPADTNPYAFQGIHDDFVLVVIDEAGGVAKTMYDAVDTLVTNEDARVLAIGNPDDPASHFAEICKPGSGWNVIRISAWDVLRALKTENVPDRLHKVLISETWINERRHRWGVGSPLWQSKVEGLFPEISDDTLITPAMIRKAFNCDLPGLEKGAFALDVARMGADETTLYRNRGGQIRLIDKWSRMDTMATVARAGRYLRETGFDVPMVVDIVGVGGGVYDRMRELNYPMRAFEASVRSSRPIRFANLRAEMYWTFRELMDAGFIDLDEADDILIAQLLSIRFIEESNGRIHIESKKDMRKRALPSPDRADAAVMSLFVSVPESTILVSPNVGEPGVTDDLLDKVM